jgi:hypothetical protein
MGRRVRKNLDTPSLHGFASRTALSVWPPDPLAFCSAVRHWNMANMACQGNSFCFVIVQ